MPDRTLLIAQAEKTREVYWGMSHDAKIIWYVVSYGAVAVFVYGVMRMLVKYSRGRGPETLPFRRLPGRVVPTLMEIYSHSQIGRRDG